jgi:prevent-host-death family protein
MRTVTAMDLRRHLGEILDAAAAGEPITVERDGRPMAVLVTPEAAANLDGDQQARIQRGLAALDRLDEFRERMASHHPELDDAPTTAEWIRQERDARDGRIAEAASRRRDDPVDDHPGSAR